MTRADELALARRALAGDTAARNALLLHHWPGIATLAWRYTRRRHVADDLRQAAFLKCLTAFPNYKPDSNLRGYLFVVARNAMLDLLKFWKDHPLPQADYYANSPGHHDARFDVIDPRPTLSEQQEDAEENAHRYARVMRFLPTLPKQQQKALRWIEQGVRPADTSRRLNVPWGSAKNWYYRGVCKMRQLVGAA
jgi:RNA polymerase sigma factor (sigma-70 family)